MHRFHPVKRYSTSYHHRKAATIAATVVATLAIFAGAAFAEGMFSARGSANSTDTVATSWHPAVIVAATNLADGLTPGATGSDMVLTVTNNNSYAVDFNGVNVNVISTSNEGCDADNFSVQEPTSYSDSLNGDFGGELQFSMLPGDIVTANGVTVTLSPYAPADCAGATVNLSEVVGET
jgi:hypothetical protein